MFSLNSESHLKQNFIYCSERLPFPQNNEKCFLFHLKSSFCSQDMRIFVLPFWSCRKSILIKTIRLISKFMTSQPGKQTIAIYMLSNIWRNKGNQISRFVQVIEYSKRNIFIPKWCRKWGKGTSSNPLFVLWKSFKWGKSKYSAVLQFNFIIFR